jgi:phosphoesterase RecJ-like protein
VSAVPYPPPPALVALLERSHRLWLATHVNPDADGVGSMLGLGIALRAAGKEVAMVRHPDAPAAFVELPGYDQTLLPGQLSGEADAIILFDCHSLQRTGEIAGRLTGRETVVVIDHHLHDGDGGDGHLEWFVPEAAASACLVYCLLRCAPWLSLAPESAACLYAGLLADTGGFRFSNTTPATLRIGAELVEHGADPARLADLILHRRSAATLALLSRVLEGIEYRSGGRIALLWLTQAMLRATGARASDTEGFVNFATSAQGVQLVAMFKEETPTRWRVSLRANGARDVRAIAARHGGGGHSKAAGFTLDGAPEQIAGQVLGELEAELARDRPGP